MGEKWMEEVAKAGGWEEHALEDLRKTLEMKEAREALKSMGEMDKDTWSDINSSISKLADFVTGGGVSTIKDEISNQFNLVIMDALSPIINEISPLISKIFEAFEPVLPYITTAISFIVDVLTPIIDWIADAIAFIISLLTPTDLTGIIKKTLRDLGLYMPGVNVDTGAAPVSDPYARIKDFEPGFT